jgi:hypothetical protein
LLNRKLLIILLIVSINILAQNNPLDIYKKVEIKGVSLVELLITPDKVNKKHIKTFGYIIHIKDGVYGGYWISLYAEEFDMFSSIKLNLEESAPQKNWLTSKQFVSVTGYFEIDGIKKTLTPLVGGILPK